MSPAKLPPEQTVTFMTRIRDRYDARVELAARCSVLEPGTLPSLWRAVALQRLRAGDAEGFQRACRACRLIEPG